MHKIEVALEVKNVKQLELNSSLTSEKPLKSQKRQKSRNSVLKSRVISHKIVGKSQKNRNCVTEKLMFSMKFKKAANTVKEAICLGTSLLNLKVASCKTENLTFGTKKVMCATTETRIPFKSLMKLYRVCSDHANAPDHTTFFMDLKLSTVPQLPYSFEVGSSDLCLPSCLKSFMKGHHFGTEATCMEILKDKPCTVELQSTEKLIALLNGFVIKYHNERTR